jgi:hypothetical protein
MAQLGNEAHLLPAGRVDALMSHALGLLSTQSSAWEKSARFVLRHISPDALLDSLQGVLLALTRVGNVQLLELLLQHAVVQSINGQLLAVLLRACLLEGALSDVSLPVVLVMMNLPLPEGCVACTLDCAKACTTTCCVNGCHETLRIMLDFLLRAWAEKDGDALGLDGDSALAERSAFRAELLRLCVVSQSAQCMSALLEFSMGITPVELHSAVFASPPAGAHFLRVFNIAAAHGRLDAQAPAIDYTTLLDQAVCCQTPGNVADVVAFMALPVPHQQSMTACVTAALPHLSELCLRAAHSNPATMLPILERFGSGFEPAAYDSLLLSAVLDVMVKIRTGNLEDTPLHCVLAMHRPPTVSENEQLFKAAVSKGWSSLVQHLALDSGCTALDLSQSDLGAWAFSTAERCAKNCTSKGAGGVCRALALWPAHHFPVICSRTFQQCCCPTGKVLLRAMLTAPDRKQPDIADGGYACVTQCMMQVEGGASPPSHSSLCDIVCSVQGRRAMRGIVGAIEARGGGQLEMWCSVLREAVWRGRPKVGCRGRRMVMLSRAANRELS